MILIPFNYESFTPIFMSNATEVLCVECEESVGERVNKLGPLQIKCSNCIHTPGIFQEMGADPDDRTNLFKRGFETNEIY